MTETLIAHLLRLSEHPPATLSGDIAKPFLGPAFDRAIADRLLEEIEPVEVWTPCSSCECPAGARIVEKDESRCVAVCPLDVEADLILHPDDVRRFMIDEFRLVCASLDVEPAVLCEPLPGLWARHGTGGDWVFLTLRRSVADEPALPLILTDTAQGQRTILAAPRMSSKARLRMRRCPDVTIVDISAVTVNATRPLLDLRAGARVGSVRLRVDVPRGLVHVDGRPLSIPDQRFRLLNLLLDAWEKGDAVSKDAISSAFSGREAKEVINALKNDLSIGAADKKAVRSWIIVEYKPTAYRLALPAGQAAVSR